MKKWLACSKGRYGTVLPLVTAATLAYLLILCRTIEFSRLSLIASGVKEALQDAVVVVVNGNYTNVHHGVREGYSGGYHTEGYGLEEWVDTGDIYYHLDGTLGIRWEGRSRVKYTGDILEHGIAGLDITICNTPLIPSDPVNAQRSEADAVVWLEVPVQFTGETFPTTKMKLKAQVGYIEVF